MEPAEQPNIAAVEEDHWWFRTTRALLRDQLAPFLRPGLRTLDVGCGPGGNSAWLLEHGPVTGVDLAPEAIALLRARRPGIEALEADATDLPLPDAAFDVVLSVTALSDIESDDRAAAEIARVLAPGGVTVFLEPAFPMLRRGHDRNLGTRRRYRLGGLAALASDAGLEVRRRTYAHLTPLPAAAVLAAVDRVAVKLGIDARSDTERGTLGWLFGPMSALERRFLAHHDLPLGLSALVVATRP